MCGRTDSCPSRQTTRGSELFFETQNALSSHLNINRFKVKEWSNLGHEGIGVNKQDD